MIRPQPVEGGDLARVARAHKDSNAGVQLLRLGNDLAARGRIRDRDDESPGPLDPRPEEDGPPDGVSEHHLLALLPEPPDSQGVELEDEMRRADVLEDMDDVSPVDSVPNNEDVIRQVVTGPPCARCDRAHASAMSEKPPCRNVP